jgi:serine/threonine protein phosphatase PrpC
MRPDPQIKHIDLDGSEDYLIIGCDGFWECIDTKTLTDLVNSNKNNGSNIAEVLARQAKENGSLDNISVIFIMLKRI